MMTTPWIFVIVTLKQLQINILIIELAALVSWTYPCLSLSIEHWLVNGLKYMFDYLAQRKNNQSIKQLVMFSPIS